MKKQKIFIKILKSGSAQNFEQERICDAFLADAKFGLTDNKLLKENRLYH